MGNLIRAFLYDVAQNSELLELHNAVDYVVNLFLPGDVVLL